jgi:hypothetical protein
MAFKVRDLMINILTSQDDAPPGTFLCAYSCPPATYCGLSCPPGSIKCHSVSNARDLYIVTNACDAQTFIGPFADKDDARRVSDLAKVKKQFQDILAALDDPQALPPHRDLQFETADQIEDLQAKLRDAMAELDERKSQLIKRQQAAS